MKRPPALMFGVPIADLNMADTLELIGDLVDAGRRERRAHQIATTNVDFLVNALDDPELRAILQSADVCLADGMPVVWGAALLGMPIEERVAGADLVPALVAASEQTGWRVHIFGSSPSVASRAEALFAERHPRARVTLDPGPKIADPTAVPEEVLASIEAAAPDILCVALGNPKQEWFIRANRARLRVPVMIGVGGSLDMLVGERRRAPEWMQRTGTEWIARLVQEPARLGPRYARDLWVFGPRLAREWRAVRSRRHEPGLQIEVGEGFVAARLGGPSTPGDTEWSAAIASLAEGAELRLSGGPVGAIRDDALAVLVGLVREAERRSCTVRWLDDPSALRAAVQARDLPFSLVAPT